MRVRCLFVFGFFFFFFLLNYLLFREWLGKVDRMRARPTDGQEGWKEGSEDRGGSKASWAESVDPRAPSPGSMGQYNKSAATQDFQVKHVQVTEAYYHVLILLTLLLPPHRLDPFRGT